jgi:asparagine synthase (glutamine-hydrolysing)
MCGIAGILASDGRTVEQAVRRMMRAMIHRGPDDEGYEQFPLGPDAGGDTCGFGFRRLAIMDLSPAGHQPMVNAATGDVLIFNGEIYNFVDLRRRLKSQGCSFRSTGDSEVLLQALGTWGELALDELDGMFACAFYHAASRRVLLARDPLGIKPLYLARVSGAVVFASEVRAVLASGLVSDELDPAGIAGCLAYGAPQDPLTVHRAIRSLPSGTCEWLDAGALAGRPPAPRRYWSFPAVERPPAEPELVAAIRADLARSVRRQCAADVPLGVFLSGGIDSATMAAFAATGTADHGPVSSFAVGYEVPGAADETKAAAETAHAIGTRHFQTIVDDDWSMLQWYEWLKAADRPSIDGLNTYIVSGVVKDHDITVALSGLGADELFGGYPSFRRVPRAQLALAAVAWLPRDLRRAAAGRLLGGLPADKRAKVVDVVASSASAIELAALARRTQSDAVLHALGLDARRLGLTPSYLPAEAIAPLESRSRDTFAAVSRTELALYMGNTLLRDADTNSMAHSLEIRVPFLGRQLVDRVSRLPGCVRAPRGAQPKHLLRKAVGDRLPAAVFNRPKTGFSLPFGDWMFGPLREQCEAAIESLAACPLFDAGVVRQMWAEYDARRKQIHWSRPLSLVVLGSYLGKAGQQLRSPVTP